MHWCMDETLAVLAMIPFLRFFFAKLHAWYHKNHHHKCHTEGCNATHVDHCNMPENIPHGKVGEGQCDQHPLSWDEIPEEDVEERFGVEILNDLFFTILNRDDLIGATREEFTWYVNDAQEMMVKVRGRVFIHGYEQCEHGWDEVFH